MIKAIKRYLAYGLAVLFIAWESLIYKPSHAIFEKLSKLIVLDKVEHFIKSLSPWASVSLFFVILVILFPLKLSAVWLMHKSILAGGLSYFGLKIIGMFLISRTFELVEPNLRKIEKIDKLLTKFFDFKNKVVAFYKETKVYVFVHNLKLKVKEFSVFVKTIVLKKLKELFK